MNISASSGAFARALSVVHRASSLRSAVPVLSAVLIEAREGSLTMKATDNEMSISLESEAEIAEEGAAAVPARMLNEIASKLPECRITFSADGGQATLATNTASYTLHSHDPGDFPELPAFDPGAAFSIPAPALTEAITHASAAVSTDHSRPVLCGMLTAFSGGELSMASTDSYRLALHRAAAGGGPDEDASAIIPARALSEVATLAKQQDSVEMALTDNQAIFKAGPVVLSTRLIDGNFPEYSRLLPDSFEYAFDVDAGELRESLRRANLFCGQESGASRPASPSAPVRFTFSTEEGTLAGGKLTISSKSDDKGEATESLDAELPQHTDSFVTAFNGRYIYEGVQRVTAAGANRVRIRANEELKPVVIEPAPEEADDAGGPQRLYLLMPMRDPGRETDEAPAHGAASS